LGVIEKQALKNTIFSYIGLVLGYLNVIVFFPAYFTIEQFGLIQLIQSISVVYAQFSAFGLVNIILRYFPFFKSEDRKHSGFVAWTMLIMTAGFLLITIIYIIFRPLIISAYIERSSIFIEYYYVLIPLSFFTLLFNVFESYVRSIHRTVFAAFLKDVLFRLLITIGIFLYFFKLISFEFFVFYFVLSNTLIAFILILQFIISRKFKFNFDFAQIKFLKIREILKYGMFTLLAGSSYFFAQNIDKIMLGSLVGLEIVGIYSVFMYIATVIIFPARSLYRITVPIVANCWAENDTEQIKMIYKRSSLILMILGGIIYIGIIVNMDNISHFLKPGYKENFIFFIFLGISFLIDITGGLNSDIINTSPRFRYDTLFNLIYMISCVLLNFLFIKMMGGLGAAVATMVSMLLFNFLKWIFLKWKYNMQPFGVKNLLVLIIGIISLLAGLYFPKIDNLYLDLAVRSSLTALVYFGLLFIFKVSEDINNKIYKILKLLRVNF
jgi:O-antigen/teichoic acid export membrane protein